MQLCCAEKRFTDDASILPSRPKQQLWRPDSQRSLLVPDKADASGQIWCGQGPPPPNPMVVERFSQVISQLFQQVGIIITIHNQCQSCILAPNADAVICSNVWLCRSFLSCLSGYDKLPYFATAHPSLSWCLVSAAYCTIGRSCR